jgi:hypothetical protein
MADLILAALRRNLERAERSGNAARAERIRARLAKREPKPAVPFASAAAEARAASYGLGPDDFDFEPSGASGYTVADVERAAGANEEEGDG